MVALSAAVGAGLWALHPFLVTDSSTEGTLDPVEVAWQRVHADPNDAHAWVVLGDAQAAADEGTGAEHAYRTAIRLDVQGGLAYARLGFLLYARGEDEQAHALLAEAKRRGADAPMLDYTLGALGRRPWSLRGDAGGSSGSGVPPNERAVPDASSVPQSVEPPVVLDAGVSLDAGSWVKGVPEEAEAKATFPDACMIEAIRRGQHGTFLLPMLIDGAPGELVIDTGASMSVLTQEMAGAAGLVIDTDRIIVAITANGRVEFPTARVGWLEVGDRAARDVRVAICRDCVQGYADGLLGLDLLAILGLELRLNEGAVRMLDCDPGGRR